MSNYFSYDRCSMVSVEELGGFLIKLMDTEKVADYNESLQKRSFRVISWLEDHEAPEELIMEAKEDNAAGNKAILTLIEEIRAMVVEYKAVPAPALELLLRTSGPQSAMLFASLCQEELKGK